MKNNSKLYGFTLIELVVTIAIAAILLAVAIPSFTGLIRDNQTVSETNKLVKDLQLARSEAIKTGTPASVCASNNGGGCVAGNWANGWIVFTDNNNNGAFNGPPETIIQVNDGLEPNFTLNTGVGNRVTYIADGSTAQNGVFRICRPDQDINLSRAVTILATGRASISTVAAIAGGACP